MSSVQGRGQQKAWLNDIQSTKVHYSYIIVEIGVGISGIGLFFLILGIVLLFDAGLIIMGNVLFLAGLFMVIGVEKTINFFSQRRRWRGSACFAVGFVLVVIRWVKLGILVEAFGFINLFGYD